MYGRQLWQQLITKLDNLCVLLDYNGLQIDGTNDQVMGLGNIVEKFKAFGFNCFEVDGHNIEEIDKAIEAPVSGKPKFICCHTIKGKVYPSWRTGRMARKTVETRRVRDSYERIGGVRRWENH